mmetsp:Transcript_77777/g.224867  ORF Transcript_77777/g.224867 Transcript_77777/m.224867 type:complete len:308 (+) Transcript_77777:113-1036(+)
MIYICKGLGQLCALPCKLCEGCCKALAKCCDEFCAFLSPVLDRPLGAYVVASWLLMGAALLCSIVEVITGKCKDARVAAAVCLAVAIVHGGFALYLQLRLVAGLEARGVDLRDRRQQNEQAKSILLYDVGVCFYFFFFIGAFCFACYSFALLACGGAGGYLAASLLVLYGWCVSGYFVLWYCCNCFAGAVSGRRKRPARASGGAAPTQQQLKPAAGRQGPGLFGAAFPTQQQQQQQQGQGQGQQPGPPPQQAIPLVVGTVVGQPSASAPARASDGQEKPGARGQVGKLVSGAIGMAQSAAARTRAKE